MNYDCLYIVWLSDAISYRFLHDISQLLFVLDNLKSDIEK